ncbi:segregation and condensation protein B [Scopulibacillus darangshiensis]|uniref:Segregation and condensation protein B n=1 Tax=Scopulibacillus darangshiensis TaxID=442528 RepID=A0A4V2SNM1_9BACL|nr:SMC-Scp complex subunit ScpB [Scopulibacillus darangshiensis]TCP31696.1 segregation and condensation protein B [Scopulibacillus darangshiensis]
MKSTEMKAVIEGLLYVSGEDGLLLEQIESVIGVNGSDARALVEEMKQDWENDAKGLMIIDIAGGYQLTTKPFLADYFEKFVEAPRRSSLSQAALETLAIIAYKQPISRADIEDIRGVKSEKAIQTLVSRELVKEAGRAEGTGRAILYGVTTMFLTYFGLKSLEELPPLVPEEEDQSDEASDLFYENFRQTVEGL